MVMKTTEPNHQRILLFITFFPQDYKQDYKSYNINIKSF